MFGFGQLIDILKKDPKKIVFTEKALAVKDRIRAEVEETEGCLLQGISLEEQKEFMRIAGKMLQNLERDSRADKKGISDYEYKRS